LAARPKTLWAGLAPVLVGSAMAAADATFHLASALAALAGAVLIQVGTNFWNDYADFGRGADTEEREGPLRVTQAGLAAPRAVRRAAILAFAAAAAVSLYLVVRGGWPIAAVGVLSIAAGVLYTSGPFPLGYVGLGEVFVLVFFGPVAVGGTYYVQARALPPDVVLAGLGPGLLSVAILVVNNLRDIASDAGAGKRTLAVRFGAGFARLEYLVCILLAGAVPVLLAGWRGERPWVLLAAAGLLPAVPLVRKVFASQDGAVLNPVLAATARLLLLYSVLFAAGWCVPP
jgi:1,4-dihydroxy-2-naphthoate octaprenyltransferase